MVPKPAAHKRDLHYIVASDCVAALWADIDEFFIKRLFPMEGRVISSDEVISVMTKTSDQTLRRA